METLSGDLVGADSACCGGTGSPVPAGNSPQAVAAADLNGDGKADLVTANFISNDVTILLGNGQGGFTPAASSKLA